MTTEGYIQLPDDGDGQKVRTFEITEYDETTGDQYTVVQEAVVLSDDDGNLLLSGGLGAKRLPVTARDVVERLHMLNEGIAHLILLLNNTGHPRGPTVTADKWVQRVLGRNRC